MRLAAAHNAAVPPRLPKPVPQMITTNRHKVKPAFKTLAYLIGIDARPRLQRRGICTFNLGLRPTDMVMT